MKYIERKIIHPLLAVISLNRSEKRNALNIALLEELCLALEELHQTQSVRVVILHGKGTVFCAGLDLEEAADPEKIEASSKLLIKALEMIYNSPLIIVAAVHGCVIAGGVGLMAVCDFVIAAERTRFGLPEVHRGLTPALVSAFLCRQIPNRVLQELAFLGELIDSERAKEVNLIHAIADEDHLMETAIHISESILKGAPHAICETKKLLNKFNPKELERNLALAEELHQKMRHSKEALEGAAAFREKRLPNWILK